MAGVFNAAIFNSAVFNTGSSAPVVIDQPSNWQGHRYPRSRRLTDEEIKAQRIALGILPAEAEAVEEIAEEAVQATAEEMLDQEAQRQLLLRGLEEKRIEYAASLAAYFEFYKEALIEEELKEHFRRRRKLRMVFSLLQ